MLPAPTVEGILDRAEAFGDSRPLRDRLVSVVFADATSPVWTDLQGNRAFLDVRTADSWDLFFAGLSGFAPNPGESRSVLTRPKRKNSMASYFNSQSFSGIVRWVERGHAEAVRDNQDGRQPWRYGGGTTLVSFMVYGRDPDWLTLRDVPLYSADGTRLNLVHIAEGLARWQQDHVDPYLAPGEVMHELDPVGALLTAALGWTAEAIASGVLGDSAFELLKKLWE
jgi:hypothetical protein